MTDEIQQQKYCSKYTRIITFGRSNKLKYNHFYMFHCPPASTIGTGYYVLAYILLLLLYYRRHWSERQTPNESERSKYKRTGLFKHVRRSVTAQKPCCYQLKMKFIHIHRNMGNKLTSHIADQGKNHNNNNNEEMCGTSVVRGTKNVRVK